MNMHIHALARRLRAGAGRTGGEGVLGVLRDEQVVLPGHLVVPSRGRLSH